MAMSQQGPDPSYNVSQELIPHVHLISAHRYPSMARLDVHEVAKWLMQAPQIARNTAAFFWTFLDRPLDGTIYLVWQPLQKLGTNFATDGFIWAPPEQVFKHDMGNGLMLEIYYLKAGYLPGEQYAMHARRRFRLVPVPGHPNPPQPDPSLFLVHYGPAEPNERVPVSAIPYDERTHTIMTQRQHVQRAGPIRRKEFMLTDRSSWPTLPEVNRQQANHPRGTPQQMAYPNQATPGPAAKRARHGPNQAQAAGMQQPPPDAYDDEEDTSRGDLFDNLTPREISISRYQQNHEWMEEILSSPYRMSQITAQDLGLGLKGELASLTEGVFLAQGGDAFNDTTEPRFVGRLDPEKAEGFRKRVAEHIESTKAAIQAMESARGEFQSQIQKSSSFLVHEKELRDLGADGDFESLGMGNRPAGKDEEGSNANPSAKGVDEIVEKVEAATGKKVERKPTKNCVQEGGYQAPAPVPEPAAEPPAPAPPVEMSRQASRAESQNSGIMVGESDIDMGGTAAGLLDQMHTGFSSTSTPVNNFPTPQPQVSAGQSNAATPTNATNVASPVPPPVTAVTQPPAATDTSMGGTTEEPQKDAGSSAPDQGTGSGDWVVVPPGGGGTPDAKAAEGTPAGSNSDAAKQAAAPAKAQSAAGTPAVTDGGSVTFDQNDFSSLGDLDTAGDALAGFDPPALDGAAGELGDGLDLQMDMEDSAFGDAFHGVDASGTPGDNQNQDA